MTETTKEAVSEEQAFAALQGAVNLAKTHRIQKVQTLRERMAENGFSEPEIDAGIALWSDHLAKQDRDTVLATAGDQWGAFRRHR